MIILDLYGREQFPGWTQNYPAFFFQRFQLFQQAYSSGINVTSATSQ